MGVEFPVPDGDEISRRAERLDERELAERARVSRSTLKRVAVVLLLLSIGVGIVVAAVAASEHVAVSSVLMVEVIALAFVFESLDSSSGMGFGTALAPLLLIAGYDPLAVIPALVICQSLAGLLAGGMHHEFKNAEFSLRRPLSAATKVMLLISAIGALAGIPSVLVAYVAFDLPTQTIKTYVAVLVIAMGLFGVLRRFLNFSEEYRPGRLVGFAILAGINKAIAGGGYGPVVTLGQIFAGINEKAAAAITTLSEGFVAFVTAGVYVVMWFTGDSVDLMLVPSVLIGALFAAVVSPYIVRVLPRWILAYAIPVYATGLGVFVLVQLYA